MTAATVYTKPDCVQCVRTYALMDREGIPYETVDLTQDPMAMAAVKELGYMQAPVVVTKDDDHWSGFRPDKIKELKMSISAATAVS